MYTYSLFFFPLSFSLTLSVMLEIMSLSSPVSGLPFSRGHTTARIPGSVVSGRWGNDLTTIPNPVNRDTNSMHQPPLLPIMCCCNIDCLHQNYPRIVARILYIYIPRARTTIGHNDIFFHANERRLIAGYIFCDRARSRVN